MRETSPFTILEYIKTSIEILMNMKMEEQMELREGEKNKNRRQKKTTNSRRNNKVARSVNEGGAASEAEESESVVSGDEAPSEYESMLQKYEAEVRNHIKIEQQLKLHIECVQDKLEDQEKLLKKEVENK